MQIIKYKLIIPVSPDSINTIVSYGKTEMDIVNLKKKWERTATIFIRQMINEKEFPNKLIGKVAFFFKLYFSTKRTRDGDNYEAMCKGTIDAFVKLRIIPDDNSEIVDDDGR